MVNKKVSEKTESVSNLYLKEIRSDTAWHQPVDNLWKDCEKSFGILILLIENRNIREGLKC